jgi:phosphoglycerate dehydrogenase-like enzyme
LLADDCEQTAWREEYGSQYDMTKKVLEGEYMSETIGFIGLGDLGQPIACHLLAAGYALKAYNRTASKAEPLVALGTAAGLSTARRFDTWGDCGLGCLG